MENDKPEMWVERDSVHDYDGAPDDYYAWKDTKGCMPIAIVSGIVLGVLLGWWVYSLLT